MAKPHLRISPLNLIVFLSAFLFSPTVATAVGTTTDEVFSFSFASFPKDSSFHPEIGFYGGAEITNSTLTILRSGLLLYQKPIKFIGRYPGFSTYFSFSLSPINGAHFRFFLTLSSVRMDLLDGPPPSVISVSFIGSIDRNFRNSTRNHLQVEVSGIVPPMKTHDPSSKELVFNNGEKLHSWIDYKGGASNRLEVRLGRSSSSKPESPIASYPIDLSNVLWRETMVVGFTSSSPDNSTQMGRIQNCTLYEWRFAAQHGAPYLMHSEPLDPTNLLDPPNEKKPSYHPWGGIVMALIFAAACGAMVTFFVVFVWFSVCTHRPVAPVEYPVHPTELVCQKIVLVGVVKNVQNGVKSVRCPSDQLLL